MRKTYPFTLSTDTSRNAHSYNYLLINLVKNAVNEKIQPPFLAAAVQRAHRDQAR